MNSGDAEGLPAVITFVVMLTGCDAVSVAAAVSAKTRKIRNDRVAASAAMALSLAWWPVPGWNVVAVSDAAAESVAARRDNVALLAESPPPTLSRVARWMTAMRMIVSFAPALSTVARADACAGRIAASEAGAESLPVRVKVSALPAASVAGEASDATLVNDCAVRVVESVAAALSDTKRGCE